MGRGSKSSFFLEACEGFCCYFLAKEDLEVGLGWQEGNSHRAKAWSPRKTSAGKGEKGDLEDKVSIVHH